MIITKYRVYTENGFIEYGSNQGLENYVTIIEDDSINENEIKKAETKARYEVHKENGWEAYQDFRANIVLNIENKVITENDAFIIERFLGPAYDKISQNGDWKTGYYLLSQLVIPEEYIFVQTYLTEAIGIVINYIQNNYED